MDDNLPPRRDYRETRVETSSGGAGWLIAGVAIAAMIAVGAWIFSGTDAGDTVATDGTPAVTEPAPTDDTATSSVTIEENAPVTDQAPVTNEPAPAEETQAAPPAGEQAPADASDTVPQAQ
ncbi:MAG: hypothetical protein CMJ42_22665 [Phyllobacteriaceae bacterium]|nr:hypothetical protein [Phyllobacteriaceae bacterium]MBA91939.1 hypothetical protein [Phyllobacteriaceae bacterium]